MDTVLIVDHDALADWLGKDTEIEVVIGEPPRCPPPTPLRSRGGRQTEVGNATDWRIITRDAGPYERLWPVVPVAWP
ncbi:hypothetical protein ACQEVF_04715 [Nonomuraea polychroma]|uniref:hypothetical protein n=1 Tax=Nonomuraea polychroma TaxID=46176 RepID=UPI003D8E3A9D